MNFETIAPLCDEKKTRNVSHIIEIHTGRSTYSSSRVPSVLIKIITNNSTLGLEIFESHIFTAATAHLDNSNWGKGFHYDEAVFFFSLSSFSSGIYFTLVASTCHRGYGCSRAGFQRDRQQPRPGTGHKCICCMRRQRQPG